MATAGHGMHVRSSERHPVWSPLGVPAAISAGLALGASWYGVLADTDGHPTTRLAGALALSVLGMVAVILAMPDDPTASESVAPLTEPTGAGGADASTHVISTVLGMLSMAVALIHFAVIEQHLSEYWLYGWFFIAVGLAQLGWALLVPRWSWRRGLG